ncbi:MAG: hypothetical protein WC774_05430 [Candidatus Gracilibacteria bacterium]|jgi:hypothetical protein
MLKSSQLDSVIDFYEAMRNPTSSGGNLVKKFPFPQWLSDESTATMVNTDTERRLFVAKAARTSGDFDRLLEATKGGTILAIDHFTKKMDLPDKGLETI